MHKFFSRVFVSYLSLFSIFLNILSPFAYVTLLATPAHASDIVDTNISTGSADSTDVSNTETTTSLPLVEVDSPSSFIESEVNESPVSYTIATDRLDYAPGEKVNISGENYKPSTDYKIIISSNEEPIVSSEITVQSNEEGKLSLSYNLDNNFRLLYRVYVYDQTGTQIAETFFNDSRWVMAASLNGGSTASVGLGDNVAVELLVMTWMGLMDPNDNWRSTSYKIGDGPVICENTPNHNNSGMHIDSFSFNAPMNPGAYDITLRAYANDNCSNSTLSFPLTMSSALTVIDDVPPAVPTGLKFRNLTNTQVFSCNDYSLRQPVIPFWDQNTESDFAFYEYTSFHPNGSIGLNTQVLNTNELVNSWMPPTDGSYGFSVRSVDTAGNKSAWSPVDMTLSGSCKINYDSTSPTKPSFTSPGNDSFTSTNSITLIWTGGDDAGSGIYGYNVRYVFYPASGAPAVNWSSDWVATTAKNRSGTFGHGEGRYEIYVKVKDNLGNVSEESLPLTVTYDKTSPVVDILTPTTSLIRGSIDIRGSVEDVNPMRYYMVVKDQGGAVVAGPGTVYESDSFSDRLLYTWNTTLFDDGQYTIHLAARDLAMNRTSVSEDNKVVTIDNTKPLAPIDLSPSHNAYVQGGSITNSWSVVSDAHHYIYQSYHNEEATNIRWTQTVTAPQHSKTATNVSDATFWWRVKAVDEAGNESDWSSLYKLNVDNTDPVVTLSESAVEGLLTNENDQVFGASTSEPVTSCTLSMGEELNYPMSMVEGSSVSWIVEVNDIVDGQYTYDVTCVDRAANSGKSDSRSIIIDTKAPTLFSKTIFEGWYSEDQTSLFTYEDENGVDEETTNPISCIISTEGENQTCSIDEVNICDRAGNCNTESVESNGANIDKYIPQISLTTNPSSPNGENNWFKTQPELTLTVTDVNPDISEYQWGGTAGEWTTYVSPFKPSIEGKYMLYFRAKDKSGKYSEVGSYEVKWDQTGLTKAPFDLSVSPNPTTSDKAIVSWKAAEDAMGISKYEVEWRLGDTFYKETVGGSVLSREIDRLTEGDWKITVRAFDDAGHNLEANVGLRVDRTPPSAPTLVLGAVATGSVSLSWNSISDASEYSLWYGTSTGNYIFGAKVGNVTSYTVQGLGAGNYYFAVKAHDSAANVSSYSNEVSTGTIIGAPGVEPGTPAEGFVPAEEVLGDQTGAVPELVDTESREDQEVLGTDSTTFFGILKDWWWLWILVLVIIYIIYRRLRKARS